jgi:uncharacterized membrane protein YesL
MNKRIFNITVKTQRGIDMAGFFGFFDYTKPGPGVPKNTPPKSGIVIFFEVFFRKFWNLVKINIMFCIFNIPAILGAVFASMFIFQKSIGDEPLIDLLTRFIIGSVLLCIPVITVGPAQAGYTYILRNYSREEHAFVWWDFKDNALSNLKQSIIVCLIDYVIVIVMGIAINFYLSYEGGNLIMAAASGLIIMAFILFFMMHLYIYPMMVTFKLTIKQLYKNALLFSIMKFIPNLGIILLCTLIILLTFYFNFVIGIILYFVITVSLIGLIINFYTYPKLKKYIIDKVEQEQDDDEDEDEEDDEEYYEEDGEEMIFTDSVKEKRDK